jgi:membrane protease YdiL (CAAX protease family)
VLFAIAHLYQSDDFNELLGIVAITGTGSILFCWLYMKWKDNVWPVFGLHAGMNLWWEVFAVDDTGARRLGFERRTNRARSSSRCC